MSGASDLSSGSAGSASTATSNLTASSVASAKTLEGGDLMNITSLRLFVADIFAFKASSDAAQDLAGGPRQTLPRLVSAYFLGLQPTTDADGRGIIHLRYLVLWHARARRDMQVWCCCNEESRMELAARSLRLRRLFENSVLQYVVVMSTHDFCTRNDHEFSRHVIDMVGGRTRTTTFGASAR